MGRAGVIATGIGVAVGGLYGTIEAAKDYISFVSENMEEAYGYLGNATTPLAYGGLGAIVIAGGALTFLAVSAIHKAYWPREDK